MEKEKQLKIIEINSHYVLIENATASPIDSVKMGLSYNHKYFKLFRGKDSSFDLIYDREGNLNDSTRFRLEKDYIGLRFPTSEREIITKWLINQKILFKLTGKPTDTEIYRNPNYNNYLQITFKDNFGNRQILLDGDLKFEGGVNEFAKSFI